ncbi:MAG: isoprenylcysteine carboxylmethyltransferase family protein [Isosphaeraceae bacterium]|nr:isoprenylcysteine carboxylmethyltransferase family protein [Isosphaeraceae bacterium]
MNALETRIPPPLLMLLIGIAMWGVSALTSPVLFDPALRLVAVGALTALALSFAGGGVLAFRQSKTTIDPIHPDRAATVVGHGVFRITRNPMYLGMTLLLLAWAALLASPWAMAGPILFPLYINRFQIIPEERALSEKFGAEYGEYLRRVRRWL